MAKWLLLAVILCVCWVPGKNAAADDLSVAKDLVREAREVCGVNCEISMFAVMQARLGDLESSKQSFADAWKAAAKLEDGVERRMILDGIAEHQADAGQFQEAIDAAKRLDSRYEQAMTLGTIAIKQAEVGNPKASLQTVDLMPQEERWVRNITLQMIAMSLSENRDFAGAIRVLDRIPSDVDLATKLLAKDDRDGRLSPQEQRVLDETLMKTTGLNGVAQNQAEAGDPKAALETARGIGLERPRDQALQRIARITADGGDLAAARIALDSIRGQEQRELALVRLVAALAKVGQFKDALALADTIKDPSEKTEAEFEMAAAYAAYGDDAAARSHFKNGMAMIPGENDAHNVAAKQIVSGYLRSPRPEFAVVFAGEINDPMTRSKAFQAIAILNFEMKNQVDANCFFEKSRDAAEKVSRPYDRCVRLRELATAEFAAREREYAVQTIKLGVEAAEKVEIGGGTDVIALTEMAVTQSKIGDLDGAAPTFEAARMKAFRYPDEPYVAQLLYDVVAAQARVGEHERAIKSARQSESKLVRAQMLLGVADGILSRQETLKRPNGK